MLIFDIETEALSEEHIRRIVEPFKPPPHPGEFDPASVKYGNTKDAAKRADKLAECQAAHAKAVAEYETNCQAEEAEYWRKAIERAALSPLTGRVLAIGVRNATNGNAAIVAEEDETATLAEFWSKYAKCRPNNRKLVGQNIFGFDLPFLIRRSWMLGMDVPSTVREGRYWDRIFIDTQEVWLCGQRWGECESGIDLIGKALGLGGKLDEEGVSGATFAKLWRGTPEDRRKAQAYLLRDLELTNQVAVRLGIV
jgi:hypothetical protein